MKSFLPQFAFIRLHLRLLFFLFLISAPLTVTAQTLKIAILNADEAKPEQVFFARFRQELAAQKNLTKKLILLDDDLSAAARRALKPENPFNLSLEEAKNLGAAIDCDFFFVVRRENLRRSSFAKPVYFEAAAIIFLVSARSGRLTAWEHASFAADNIETAEKQLLSNCGELSSRFVSKLTAASESERAERQTDIRLKSQPLLEISDAVEAGNLRVPLPYKRLRPTYTEAANKAGAVATVDVSIELNRNGEVIKTEIVRWAGFNLDEAVLETIGKMQFRPAVRDGEPTASRFILRYNFRRPSN